MVETGILLTAEERTACIQLAEEEGADGQRAKALLAIDDGITHLEAAEQAGLTEGQVRYFLGKFRKERLAAFDSYAAAAETTPLEPEEAAEAAEPMELSRDRAALLELARELDELIADMRRIAPEDAGQTPYSPVRLLSLIRENIGKMTPEFVRGIRQSFEGMTAEDLRDLDTWKGLAYMMTYSARFQAEKVGDRLQGYIPEPLRPTRLVDVARKGLDKILPDIAKQILGTFEGATKEDLMDPDTWKGVWYMINYSLQFQAEQLKERLLAAEEAEK
jgi:hypothetical protein